ncbi:NADP-dependent oxidoreductase [Nevskia ramosa]|uniref:NADP-dependent oxidoreductase n=1 Tax=Nevskia ramosa TaxID=64002 RepID=UPI00048C915B|nr:NADP-dependent oxidoreductase [Nevskia ramosa]
MSSAMPDLVNRLYKLAARPFGLPKASDWLYETVAVPAPQDGELLIKVRYISLDPAMRGWMNEGKSYIKPVAIGEVMRAGTLGEVIASKHAGFAVGDWVTGTQGVQAYAISDGRGLNKVDPTAAPLPTWLNALGMPGMTGYFGLLDVGQPKAGETVVVSAAAGAVGQVVGQVAKIMGCKVVGIAGGEAKCDFVVNELGFDACIDYKRGPIFPGLAKHCPDGVDIYFDNVGGDILDAVMARLRMRARIIVCGAISQYNNTTPIAGPKNYLSLLVNRARMEGIVVFDWADRYPEAITAIAGWMREGRYVSREDIVPGIEQFPDTLLKLFRGENFGKLIIEVA